MAFTMTCTVKIGNYKPFKANALTWKRSVENFYDTAVIKLPSVTMLKKKDNSYERVETGLQFNVGDAVSFGCGYDNRNNERFRGFVSRVNFTIPVEIECEGYAFQLKKKVGINKSYKATTVKKILIDLVQDTDIKLSDAIPEIMIPKAVFKNVTGVQVLDYLKEKCLLTVYFVFDVLYVGLLELKPNKTVKFKLGWNVVKDSELVFNTDRPLADVKIKIENRKKDGTKNSAEYGPKDGAVIVKRASLIVDEKTLAKIAENQRAKLLNKGYEGSITAFAEPYFMAGDTVEINDTKYPQRTGKYFGVAETGSFTKSGGRVVIKIGSYIGEL